MGPRGRGFWRRAGLVVLLAGCAAVVVLVFLVGQGA